MLNWGDRVVVLYDEDEQYIGQKGCVLGPKGTDRVWVFVDNDTMPALYLLSELQIIS